MLRVTPQRLGAGAGIGFIVLDVLGGAISGASPALTATAAKITHYYAAHHSSLLAGAIVMALPCPYWRQLSG